jgi:hypothetical protein
MEVTMATKKKSSSRSSKKTGSNEQETSSASMQGKNESGASSGSEEPRQSGSRAGEGSRMGGESTRRDDMVESGRVQDREDIDESDTSIDTDND